MKINLTDLVRAAPANMILMQNKETENLELCCPFCYKPIKESLIKFDLIGCDNCGQAILRKETKNND